MLLAGLGVLLLLSAALNGALWMALRAQGGLVKAHEEALRASTARADSLLDRIHTSPALTLERPAAVAPLQEVRYIPDTPEADPDWNEFRGDLTEDDQ